MFQPQQQQMQEQQMQQQQMQQQQMQQQQMQQQQMQQQQMQQPPQHFMQYFAQRMMSAYDQVSRTAAVHQTYGGQPMQVVQAQPTVEYGQSLRHLKYTDRDAKKAVTLGAIQLTVGLLSIIFQYAATCHLPSVIIKSSEIVGAGLWCGIVFVVAGVLGITAGNKNTVGLIVAFMVMSIVCTLMVWCLVGFAAANLAIVGSCTIVGIPVRSNNLVTSRYVSYPYPYYENYYCPEGPYTSWMILDSFMIVLSLTEFIIAIISSAYCWKAACRSSQTNPQQQYAYVVQQPAAMYMPNQQQANSGVSYPSQQGQGYDAAAPANQNELAPPSVGVVSSPAYSTQAQNPSGGAADSGASATASPFGYPTKSDSPPGYQFAVAS